MSFFGNYSASLSPGYNASATPEASDQPKDRVISIPIEYTVIAMGSLVALLLCSGLVYRIRKNSARAARPPDAATPLVDDVPAPSLANELFGWCNFCRQ
jgi:hypothetical protein